MDQGTQKNAAMVEETTAASHGLASDVQALNALLGRFDIGGSAAAGRTVRAPHLHVVPSTPPPPASEQKVARKSPGQWNIKAVTDKSRPATSPALALSDKLAGALGVRQDKQQDKGNDGDWEEF
jgi:methyl-accepting chemotaxis protein